MKKLTKILLLSLLLIGGSVIDAYCICTITIKIARHRDCRGFGWCNAKIVIEKDVELEYQSANAEASQNQQRRLVITLNKKTDLSAETFETYFSKGTFLCEDDFPLPSEIIKAVGLDDGYVIKAGKYPINIKGDILKITF